MAQMAPLRRLFGRRRACVITNPTDDSRRALAVPFAVEPQQQCIVLAAIRPNAQLDAPETLFTSALESLVLGPAPGSIPTFKQGDLRAELLAVHRNSCGMACEATSRDAVAQMTQRRGWVLDVAQTLVEMAGLLDQGAVDVILFDGPVTSDPIRLLRTIRRETETCRFCISIPVA